MKEIYFSAYRRKTNATLTNTPEALSHIDTLPKGFYASLGTVTGLTICLLSLLYWA